MRFKVFRHTARIGALVGTLGVAACIPCQIAEAQPASAPTSSSSPTAPSSQVDQWINQAVAVLKGNGYSASQLNTDDIRTIIQHESSGNPNAINNHDANAAKGTPSKGLMQIIDPTFNEYALPGHKDIWNPDDNIIAGVRYAIARYGSMDNVPGIVALKSGQSYRGY